MFFYSLHLARRIVTDANELRVLKDCFKVNTPTEEHLMREDNKVPPLRTFLFTVVGVSSSKRNCKYPF